MGPIDKTQQQLRQMDALYQGNPLNRMGPSQADQQRMVLERVLTGIPRAWMALQMEPEWEQLALGSPLHPDQLIDLVRRLTQHV